MVNEVIPIILVQDTNNSILKIHLLSTAKINIVEVVKLENIESISPPAQSVPDILIVINFDQLDRETAVFAGLQLRNAGHQVIISTENDFDELVEVITDIFSYTSGLSDKASPFRTELLVTEYAMHLFGDISLIVKKFEEKYL